MTPDELLELLTIIRDRLEQAAMAVSLVALVIMAVQWIAKSEAQKLLDAA